MNPLCNVAATGIAEAVVLLLALALGFAAAAVAYAVVSCANPGDASEPSAVRAAKRRPEEDPVGDIDADDYSDSEGGGGSRDWRTHLLYTQALPQPSQLQVDGAASSQTPRRGPYLPPVQDMQQWQQQ